MGRQLLPVFALLLSTAFLLAGNGLHSLLLPLRGSAEGFSTNDLGLLGTGWAVGFILGCLTAPARRRPRRPHPRLRLLRRQRRHHHPSERHAGQFAGLDRARRLRIFPRRSVHDHRELAERAHHKREPRRRLRRLSLHHLFRADRRPVRRRRRRSDRRHALHGRLYSFFPRRAADGALDRRLAAAADARQARPGGLLPAIRRSPLSPCRWSVW